MFSFKKKAPKKAPVKLPKLPKPTKKAAGVKKAPVAPSTAVVANTDMKPAVNPAPTPVVIVQPVPEQIIQPNPEPPPRPPDPPKALKPMKGVTPDEEQAELERQILAIQARIREIQNPYQEYPKMVTPKNGMSRTFATREEQDAAGPEYRDKK